MEVICLTRVSYFIHNCRRFGSEIISLRALHPMTPGQLKSPRPTTRSAGAYKRQQAAISRHRLYPVTAFYTFYSAMLLVLEWQTPHRYQALAFYVAGIPIWTLFEYLSHRFVFHKHFHKSQKFYKKFYMGLANKYLDPLHWGHHERPTDGLHINGELKDLLPLFVVFAPLSFIFPAYTGPMMLAGFIQSYVVEEWIHHSIHFYKFRNPYFNYIKRHHLYHHTSAGINKGFGITSGFWDVIFQTRYPEATRQRLYSRSSYAHFPAQPSTPTKLNIETRSSQ